jgi:hypothetical protein
MAVKDACYFPIQLVRFWIIADNHQSAVLVGVKAAKQGNRRGESIVTIDEYVTRINEQMAEVHPQLPGQHSKDYMKNYIKTTLLLYEKLKHEELMEQSRNRFIVRGYER